VEARDTKVEPDLQPIRTLKDVDMICHLWQQYTNVALLPLANTSVTVRREMSIFNNQTLSRVEGGANSMLQRVADGMSWKEASNAVSDNLMLHSNNCMANDSAGEAKKE